MPPYNCWAHQFFRDTLIAAHDKYLESTDHGPDRTWTKLIAKVSQDISDTAKGQMNIFIPDNLENVFPLRMSQNNRYGMLIHGLVTMPADMRKNQGQQRQTRHTCKPTCLAYGFLSVTCTNSRHQGVTYNPYGLFDPWIYWS